MMDDPTPAADAIQRLVTLMTLYGAVLSILGLILFVTVTWVLIRLGRYLGARTRLTETETSEVYTRLRPNLNLDPQQPGRIS